MVDLPEISARVYDLADRIADDAITSEDKDFRLDAFKALSNFFIGTTRLSGKLRDDEDQAIGVSVPEMRARIAEAGQNGAPAELPLVAGARRRAAGEARDRDRNGRFE